MVVVRRLRLSVSFLFKCPPAHPMVWASNLQVFGCVGCSLVVLIKPIFHFASLLSFFSFFSFFSFLSFFLSFFFIGDGRASKRKKTDNTASLGFFDKGR